MCIQSVGSSSAFYHFAFLAQEKLTFQVQQGLIHVCTELLLLILLIIVILVSILLVSFYQGEKKGGKRGKNPGRQTASTAGTAGELNCRFLPSINLTLYQTLSIAILKIPSFYLYRVDILKENSIWESTARKNKI